jgi:predicted negative regulator of RcsB-dependent stress response
MTKSATPSDSKPSGDDRNLVVVDENYVAPTFEDKLHLFWKNNGKIVIATCIVILLAILAKGGWEMVQSQREVGIENQYAAATTPEQLKAFAAANPGHSLAGLAHLRLADEAYAASRFADALAGYEKASATLKAGPLAARAQLGLAMAKISSDKSAEGEAALKQLANDTTQLKGIRSEATYHLASLAAEAGRVDDVTRLSDQLMQLDASGFWAQRAMALRASLPAPAAAVKSVDPTAPGAAPSVQVKLPGQP